MSREEKKHRQWDAYPERGKIVEVGNDLGLPPQTLEEIRKGMVRVVDVQALHDAWAEIEKLKKRLAAFSHNHITRDIKDKGQCPACDQYHLKAENERYRKALEFYADADNWGHISPHEATYSVIDKVDLGKGEFMLNEMTDDDRVGGRKAREVLKGGGG